MPHSLAGTAEGGAGSGAADNQNPNGRMIQQAYYDAAVGGDVNGYQQSSL